MAINKEIVVCKNCKMENPYDLKKCVRCGHLLPLEIPEKYKLIPPDTIPDNPSSESIDFDKDGETYVVIFLINRDPGWFELSREKKIELTEEHVDALSIYADKMHRTTLHCEGLSKYDYVELIEADDLKIVNSLIHTLKSRASKRMTIVDAIVTIKGKNVLARLKGKEQVKKSEEVKS